MQTNEKTNKKILSSNKSIALYCREWCSSGSKKEVKKCPNTDCPLWPRRMGEEPNRKKGRVRHRDTNSSQFLTLQKAKTESRKGTVSISETKDKMTIEIEKEK